MDPVVQVVRTGADGIETVLEIARLGHAILPALEVIAETDSRRQHRVPRRRVVGWNRQSRLDLFGGGQVWRQVTRAKLADDVRHALLIAVVEDVDRPLALA